MRENHAELVFEKMSDERLWTFFPHLRPSSVDDLRRLYRRWQAGAAPQAPDETWENWLCLLRTDGTPVGGAQATLFSDHEAMVAYATYTDYQRRGYTREAISRVLAHLAHDHGVNKVRAEMDRRNEASIGVVKALGFTRSSQRAGANDLAFELRISEATRE